MSFSTSSSVVNWKDNLHFRVNGSAGLTHVLNRTSVASLQYARSTDFDAGFRAPLLSDSVSGGVSTQFGRRASLSGQASVMRGSIGFDDDAGTVKSYIGRRQRDRRDDATPRTVRQLHDLSLRSARGGTSSAFPVNVVAPVSDWWIEHLSATYQRREVFKVIPGKQYTPELVLAIAWRRKWLIVIPAVLIVTGSFVYARSLPDVYISSTLISVVPQKVPENFVKSTVTTDINARLRAIDQEARTRSRLERTIEEFNLFPEKRKTATMQDLVDEMNAGIQVNHGAGRRV